MLHNEVFLKTSTGHRSILIDDDLLSSMGVTAENRETSRTFLCAWLTLLADSPLSGGQKPFRTYRKFISNLQRNGLKATILSYADLAHVFVSQQHIYGTSSLQGEWIDGFEDTPVFFEYVRYHKSADPTVAKYLYTFLNFGKKLEYVDETFASAAFRGWLDTERRLSELQLDDLDVFAMKRILAALLPSFTWTDLRPKFGPGAVYERGVWGAIEKLHLLTRDPLIERFLLSGQLGMYGQAKDLGVDPLKIGFTSSTAIANTNRVARLLFVPKSLKTYRSVCIEPNVLMYWQQAVAKQMMVHVDSSVYKNYFVLRDQSRNRDLAVYGSFSGSIDTLDLSSASDSVSWDLVKGIFPPSWVIAMSVTRSTSVELPNGDLFPVKKFAPMGSAVCFPTQSIIFATVCIYAACLREYRLSGDTVEFAKWLSNARIKRVARLFARMPSLSRRTGYEPLGIYGDDICIDTRLTDIVIPILTRLGFLVNTGKSFYGSQAFRESCGGYYLNGSDITPLYFRVKCGDGFTPSEVVSEVHLANESLNRGFKTLRKYLIHRLNVLYKLWFPRNGGPLPIQYIPPNSPVFGLHSLRPTNPGLRSRQHKLWQRDEVRVWSITYEETTEAVTADMRDHLDQYLYMRWWDGCASESDVGGQPASRRDHRGLKLRWRWAPAS